MQIRRKCKCGCGRITNPGRKYIQRHHLIGNAYRKGTGKTKIRRRCKCGCGGITNYGKVYIHGHSQRNKKHSKEVIKKMSIAKMGNTCGKGNKGYKRSEERKLKQSLAMMGNTYGKGNKGRIRSEKYKEKISRSWEGRIVSEKTKRKNSLSAIEMWKNPEYQRKQFKAKNLKPNKSEIKLGEILNQIYPNEYKYVGDFQFFLGGRNPDFMNINGQKKLIELYGDYWHRDANPQNRIDHFKQYGFNTLVIWENELKKSRLQLRRKLIGFHRRK